VVAPVEVFSKECDLCGEVFHKKYALSTHKSKCKKRMEGWENSVTFECNYCKTATCDIKRIRLHYFKCERRVSSDLEKLKELR
jgi:hypothetical protein